MLVQEHDKLTKRTKPEKLSGQKRSIVEEVFGSYFLNTVLCLDCMRVSRTRDPTLDVSVTISFKQANTSHQEKELRRMIQDRAGEASSGKVHAEVSCLRRMLCCLVSH